MIKYVVIMLGIFFECYGAAYDLKKIAYIQGCIDSTLVTTLSPLNDDDSACFMRFLERCDKKEAQHCRSLMIQQDFVATIIKKVIDKSDIFFKESKDISSSSAQKVFFDVFFERYPRGRDHSDIVALQETLRFLHKKPEARISLSLAMPFFEKGFDSAADINDIEFLEQFYKTFKSGCNAMRHLVNNDEDNDRKRELLNQINYWQKYGLAATAKHCAMSSLIVAVNKSAYFSRAVIRVNKNLLKKIKQFVPNLLQWTCFDQLDVQCEFACRCTKVWEAFEEGKDIRTESPSFVNHVESYCDSVNVIKQMTMALDSRIKALSLPENVSKPSSLQKLSVDSLLAFIGPDKKNKKVVANNGIRKKDDSGVNALQEDNIIKQKNNFVDDDVVDNSFDIIAPGSVVFNRNHAKKPYIIHPRVMRWMDETLIKKIKNSDEYKNLNDQDFELQRIFHTCPHAVIRYLQVHGRQEKDEANGSVRLCAPMQIIHNGLVFIKKIVAAMNEKREVFHLYCHDDELAVPIESIAHKNQDANFTVVSSKKSLPTISVSDESTGVSLSWKGDPTTYRLIKLR